MTNDEIPNDEGMTNDEALNTQIPKHPIPISSQIPNHPLPPLRDLCASVVKNRRPRRAEPPSDRWEKGEVDENAPESVSLV